MRRRSRAGWLPDLVDNVRSEGMSHLNSGMVEESMANHAEPLHHSLRWQVDDCSHRPNHREPEPIEPHVERRPRRFGRVALVPRAPIEPPADLLIASARNTIRHGVESGEADELTGLEDLKCPEPKTLLIEACIDAVDELVTFITIQCGREVAHDFGIGVQAAKGALSLSHQRRISRRSVWIS
jgi:hypothetical protein